MLVRRMNRTGKREDSPDRYNRSTDNPSWRQIALALRKLDRRNHTGVELILENTEKGEPQGNLLVRGGSGKYLISGILAGQRNTRSYFDKTKVSRGHTRIQEYDNGGGTSVEEEDLCDDLDLMLRIVRCFAERGEFYYKAQWRCV